MLVFCCYLIFQIENVGWPDSSKSCSNWFENKTLGGTSCDKIQSLLFLVDKDFKSAFIVNPRSFEFGNSIGQ